MKFISINALEPLATWKNYLIRRGGEEEGGEEEAEERVDVSLLQINPNPAKFAWPVLD